MELGAEQPTPAERRASRRCRRWTRSPSRRGSSSGWKPWCPPGCVGLNLSSCSMLDHGDRIGYSLGYSKTTDRTSRLEVVLGGDARPEPVEKGEPMEERRRSRRAAPAHDVNIIIGGNRPARVVDVSADGAHLELTSALNPRGECTILACRFPTVLLRIKARVVHCKLTGFAGPESGGQPGLPRGSQISRCRSEIGEHDPSSPIRHRTTKPQRLADPSRSRSMSTPSSTPPKAASTGQIDLGVSSE